MVLLRHSNITIDQATDAVSVFQGLFCHEDKIDRDKEHVYVMHLNSRRQINLVELVAIGTLTNATIHPRETYRRAVSAGTDSILIGHNHPSGDVTPSEADINVTTQLCQAGEILQIPLEDHLIFTPTTYYSFRNNKTAHYAILTKPKQTQVERYGMKKHSMEGGEETNEQISQ
jgi:DNA repair protein RadC